MRGGMAMADRLLRVAVASALFCLPGAGFTQSQPAPANIEGVWRIASPTTELRPVKGSPPLTARGRKEYENNKKLKASGAYDDYDIAISRCSNPGVPRLMLTPQRFKIWNRLGFVTFDFEWNRALRQIDMRGVKLERPLVPTMTGSSAGKWEGETLVATTIDISERTLLDDLLPHSVDMTVAERFRLLDQDTLEYRVTIKDPEYYTRPWQAVLTYKRQPDAIFPEDVCLDRLPRQNVGPSS